MTRLEDRTVPAVTVAALADAVEGGSAGTLRFSRTGSTAGSLTATYLVPTTGPGLATPGTDYQALSGAVTFPAGAATADVAVAAYDDGAADPNEAVEVVVQGGTGYTAGDRSAAAVGITDASTGSIAGEAWADGGDGVRIGPEPGLSEVTVALYRGSTLVGTQVTGPDGSYRFAGLAPAADYQVQFTPLAADQATFSPADQGGDDAVDSDANPATGRTGLLAVAAGTGAANVDVGLNLVAALAPRVEITFPQPDNNYTIQLTLTTAGGRTYTAGPITVSAHSGKDARAIVKDALAADKWAVDDPGNFRLAITGYQEAGGLDPVKNIQYKVFRPELTFPDLSFRGNGGATVGGADLNNPSADSRTVWVSFSPDGVYNLVLSVTTVGGETLATRPITVSPATSGDVRDSVLEALSDQLPAGWVVEKGGDGALVIRGKSEADMTTDPVSAVTLTLTGAATTGGPPPLLRTVGGAKAVRR